jgi:predicted NACHT family NTPase
LLKLAANPFMLSMLIVVYAAQEALPENRATLFSEFVETLLTRENLLEQRESLLSGLKNLAWSMQQQTNDSDRAVQTTLARQHALEQVNEQTLLQAARANLLDAGDDVRFSHQLLQEYFTALMMKEKLEKIQLDARSLWPAGQFWKPSGWEEATILLAGLYATDCSAVLRWLLPVHPELLARCIRQAGVPYDGSVLEE